MQNIVVEIKSFISKEQYDQLIEFFKNNARFIKEDYQETFNFNCEEDLRIQKNESFSKICLKKRKIHDDFEDKIEIKFDKNDFEKLGKLFISLGFTIQIKWFRKRLKFQWGDVNTYLDFTKGYGYIIKLEKIGSEAEKEEIYENLKQKLKFLKVEISSKEEFDKKFDYYKENWKVLTRD